MQIGTKNPRRKVALATEFCRMAPNFRGLSNLELAYVTLLSPRILRSLLDFWKINAPDVDYIRKYILSKCDKVEVNLETHSKKLGLYS
jgi:hypothetical protein